MWTFFNLYFMYLFIYIFLLPKRSSITCFLHSILANKIFPSFLIAVYYFLFLLLPLSCTCDQISRLSLTWSKYMVSALKGSARRLWFVCLFSYLFIYFLSAGILVCFVLVSFCVCLGVLFCMPLFDSRSGFNVCMNQ